MYCVAINSANIGSMMRTIDMEVKETETKVLLDQFEAGQQKMLSFPLCWILSFLYVVGGTTVALV